MLELPETREEITVWALEHGQVKRYLHYVQNKHPMHHRYPHLALREQVLEWLERIRPMAGIVQFAWQRTNLPDSTRDFESGYYRVSVASIVICTITPQEHAKIVRETRA
jgi:hypothetical protein